jgi:DNA-binding transcriptional ArsR family regulator
VSVEERALLERSPLMVQVLRLLESRDATLGDIAGELRKTKPSTYRALDGLMKIGLVESQKNPEDGRSPLFVVQKKDIARDLLRQVSYTRIPKHFRAMPFAMSGIENMVKYVLEDEFEAKGWSVTRRESEPLDFILERARPTLRVGLELKLGGDHFDQRVYETVGQLLSIDNPPQLIVLAVFGAVKKKSKELSERRLALLLGAQKSVARFLWLDRGILGVDRAYVTEYIARPILEWTEEMSDRAP